MRPMIDVATLASTELGSYLPILILVAMAATFGVFNVLASNVLGPSRTGKVKEMTYESGMNPVGSAHKRFNVRFYIIAMIFLVFDIEIIFLYPWAITFPNIDQHSSESLIWLGRILFFVFTTVVAYAYGVRKGVFKFD
jgi:NADH-quinone oxidoreductase subunit A